jgi:hypothetical protein
MTGIPQPAGRTSCWRRCGSASTARRTRRGCPAASSSGWRSPGRWSTARRCCWPTSRPARWTAPNGEQIGELLLDLNWSGQTLVIVTHNPGLAGRYASRMIDVADGRIASDAEVGAWR